MGRNIEAGELTGIQLEVALEKGRKFEDSTHVPEQRLESLDLRKFPVMWSI